MVEVFEMESDRDELRKSEETSPETGITLSPLLAVFTTVFDDDTELQLFEFRLACGCVVVKRSVALWRVV